MTSSSSPPPPPPPSSPPPPPTPPPPPPPLLPCASDRPAPECAFLSPARIEGVAVASSNGVVDDVFDEMPESSHFKVLDRKEYIDKYKRYNSDYTRLLLAKYFSSKNIYGGNIYEEKMTIGDDIIKSSRWLCTQSYSDPMKHFQEQTLGDSVTTEKMHSSFSNGNLPVEKND